MIEDKSRPIPDVAREVLSHKVSYRGIENIQPPHPLWRSLVDLATRYYANPLTIEGQDNLHRAQEMAQERGGGIVILQGLIFQTPMVQCHVLHYFEVE